MAVDGYLNFDTKINTKGFNAGTRQITNGLSNVKSMLGKVGGAVATAFTVHELVSFSKEAINMASDIQEVQNVVDVSFGHLKGQMEEFAESSIQTYGISKLTAKQTGSTYMAMAKGMQIADDAAADMATTLTGLSADMASFYNKDQSVTATALNSIFTGETETLKQFGIVMTEANLQSFAYTQGINKKISAMSQAEKVQLRYNYVMQQTSLAQGDFARTQDGWANQTRILSEQWKEFSGTVGTILMNTLLPAVQTLNKALEWLNTTARNVLEALSAIFDWDTESSSGNSVSQEIENAVDNQNELTDAVEETIEAQKRELMGFDRIKKLSDDSDSSSSNDSTSDLLGGSMTATMKLDADVEEAEKELTGVAARIKEAWEKGDYAGLGSIFAEQFNSALYSFANDIDYEGIKAKIKPKIQSVVQGINSFVDEVDWSLLTEGLSNSLSLALSAVDFTLEELDFKAIGGIVGELIEGIDFALLMGDLGDLLSSAFSGAFDILSGFLQSLNFSEIFSDIYEGIKNFFKNIDWSEVCSSIAEFFGSALGTAFDLLVSGLELGKKILGDIADGLVAVKDYFKDKIEEAGGNVILGIWNGIKDALSTAGKWIKDNIFTPFVDGFKKAFGIETHATTMAPFGESIIDGLKEGIGNIWSKISDKFTDMLKNIKAWFEKKKSELEAAWENFTSVVKDITAKIKAEIATKIEDFKKNWGEFTALVKDKVAEMKAEIKSDFKEFKKSWDAFSSLVKSKTAEMKAEIKSDIKKFKKSWEAFSSLVKSKTAEMKAKIASDLKKLGKDWKGFTSLVKDKTANMKAKISTSFKSFKKDWNGFSSLVKSKTASMEIKIKGKLDDFKKSWKKRTDLVKDKTVSFKASFPQKVEELQKGALEYLNPILEVFEVIPNWFETTFSNAWTKVKNVFSSGGKVFSGIKDGILDGLKTVINALIDGINAVIATPFKGINTALEKIKNTSIAGSKPFYNRISLISVPAIPKLATGTVVPANYGEFLAVLGDNKRETEVVSPLSTIKQAVAEVVGSGKGNETINLTVELDGEVVYRKVVKKNKQNTKMTGVNELATA